MLNSKKVLWILLIITLILSASGIILRMTNESQNKAVITTIDYREFKRMADYANRDIDEVLDDLKANGLKAVTVKETTLRDLEYNGDVKLSTYGEFQAAQIDKSVSSSIKLNDDNISIANLTVQAKDKKVISFINKYLNLRFDPQDIKKFELDNTTVFIINAELEPPLQSKDEKYETDVRLGFDREVLNTLKEKGFEIILSPGNSPGSNAAYIDEYNELVKSYGIKYLVFDGQQVSGYPDNLEAIEKVIYNNDLLIGIIETSVQLGYIDQKGIDQVMRNTGYPVNRVYSTRNDEYLKDINERYYRWIRAVVDRGIRIVHVVPFQNDKVGYSGNLENTINTIGRFHDTIMAKGFLINEPLTKLSAQTTDKVDRLMVGLSLLIGSMLYLMYLFRIKKGLVWALIAVGSLGLAGLNLILDADLSKIYALGAAILYPSFSSLLLLIYLRDNKEHSFIRQIITSLAIILGINALGMYTIVTTLADIRYIMNIEYFRGVKIAFILPLLLFILNYLACFSGEEGVIRYLIKYLKLKPNYFMLMLLGLGAAAFYYYIGRSGHTAGVSVSSLELRIREILETIFYARPRFKEILIGYPSLFALIYLYRKYKHELITLVFGLGVVMGSISMVNSFSHVFTAVTVSLSRTVAGFFTGIFIALAVLVGVIIADKIYNYIQKLNYKKLIKN